MIGGGEVPAAGRARSAGLLLVVALALAVHARALGGEFFFDDRRFIVDNAALAEVGNPARFFTDPACQDPARPPDIYRPLRTLAFAVERAVFGLNPAPFHAVQVALHAACAGLVFLLLARLGLGTAAAAAGGAIFAVHPAQVEAVAWISSLADGMGAFFTLLSVHAWLRSRGPDRWAAGAILAGLLACLSKEAAIVFPGFLLLADLARPGGGPAWLRSRWRSHLLPILLAAAFGLAVREVLTTARGRVGHFGWWGGSFGTNLATAAEAAAYQGIFALLPFVPSTEWYIEPARSLLEPGAILCGLGVAAVLGAGLAAALRGEGRVRLAGVGVLFFALGGLMTSHLLFTVGIPRTDRFLYLSLAGAALSLGAGLDRLLAVRPRAAAAVAAATILSMAAISWQRIGAFRDLESFWREASAGLPGFRTESWRISQGELEGLAILDDARAAEARGDAAAARARSAEARDLFLRLASGVEALNARWESVVGMELDRGTEMRIRGHLALALLRGGDPGGALRVVERLRSLDPGNAPAAHVAARALRTLGRLQEAGWRIEESLARGTPGPSPTEAAEVLNEAAAWRLARGLDGAALRALRLSASLVPDPRANAVVDQVPGLEAAVAGRRRALAAAFEADTRDFAAAAAFVLYEGRGGDPAAARAAFSRAFPGPPSAPATRVLWATAVAEADDREAGWRAAEAHHRETLHLAPGDAGALLGLGRCRESLGDRAGAVRAWRDVLALPGASADARREAGEGLRRAGE